MTQTLRLVSAIFFIVLFTNCNTTELKPSRSRELNYVEPQKPLSTLVVPVTVNMVDLNRFVNQVLGVELYNDVSFDDNGIDNIKVRVTKRNIIQVSVVGNAIQVIAPLKLDGVYRFQRTVLGKTLTREQPISVNLTATIQSIPNIGTDWRFSTRSKANIRWDDLPVYEFAGLRLDLPAVFSQAIERQTNQLAALADAEIPKQVKLREELLKVWPQLTTPFLIDSKTNTWFIARPKEFFSTPIKSVNGNLQFSVGINTIMEVAFGNKPEPDRVPSLFLPPMRQVPNLSNKLQVLLSPEIPFTLIDQQLKLLLKDPKFTKFESADYKFDILDAIVFPVENGLSIGVKINGWARYGKKTKKINGLLYLEGTPNFDEATQEIIVSNINYSLKTQDVLVKAASWLLKVTPLMTKLENAMRFSVAKELALAKAEANKAVNRKFGQSISLQGNISRIAPQQAVSTNTSLRMPVLAEGTISLTIDNLAKP